MDDPAESLGRRARARRPGRRMTTGPPGGGPIVRILRMIRLKTDGRVVR